MIGSLAVSGALNSKRFFPCFFPCDVMLIVAPAVVALAHVAEHLEQLGVLKDNLVGSGERLCREYHVCAGGMAASATESAATALAK